MGLYGNLAETSKRLGGVGGGAHEVNGRSVLASQKLGQAGLTDFCARMNLASTRKSSTDTAQRVKTHGVSSGLTSKTRRSRTTTASVFLEFS